MNQQATLPRETLNPSALSIEESESAIKTIARNAYLFGESEAKTLAKVKSVIAQALKKIPIERLRATAERSLMELYRRCRRTMRHIPSNEVGLLLAFMTVTKTEPIKGAVKMPLYEAENTLASAGMPMYGEHAINLGNAAQTFMKDYMKTVAETLKRLSEQQALDPYSTRRTSLRNLAEMETRFAKREADKQSLIDSGVRLVIISAHADCSDRCRPYQGKVYSLDGTSGTTTDGRHYEPLEVATNVQARSKSGKVYPYFNGLFGFNCRHFMVAYEDGYHFQQVPAATERREYAITEKQRAYERKVREWRAKAEAFKGIDHARYSSARKKAIAYNKAYIEYSQRNNRAYYPSRTRLL